MEYLHNLLAAYNATIPRESRSSWSIQFLDSDFPKYWKLVYSLLERMDRHLRIVEIGCGQGDIISIPCYLGFNDISAYERDLSQAKIASKKLNKLFGKNDIVRPIEFNNQVVESAEILILVNCVYAESIHTKREYLNQIFSWFEAANKPKYIILECIDDAYTEEDNVFPKCVRVNTKDIENLFPMAHIETFRTYTYPINKKSKKLYFITNHS